MNKNIFNVIFVVVAVIIGITMMISVLSGGGNEIGRLATYLSIACFFVGAIVPRASIFILLFLAGYSDLLKRFMVLGSSITEMDLVYVLAMAPLMLAGIVVHLLLGQTIHRKHTKADMIRFSACTLVLFAVAASAALGDGGLKSLRIVADYGAFIYLIYALPILFSTRGELLKYARVALFVFVPVAIYAIWQRLYGLADFELDYLATGLSVEARQLGQIGLRPFSTLNAATSLTIVMAASVMLTCILHKFKYLNKMAGIGLVVLFATGCIMTFTRGGWVSLAIFPIIVLVFRYKASTLLAYALAIVTVLSVIYLSDWFITNLHGWQNEISGDLGASTQAMKVTTLYDRFLGLSNLKNPENWKPFGVEQQSYASEYRYDNPTFSHDMVSRFIFKWGYVPATILLFSIALFLKRVHSVVLSQPMVVRKATTVVVGANVALLVSVAAGSYVFQFPANIFLWIITSLTLSCLKTKSGDEDENPVKAV